LTNDVIKREPKLGEKIGGKKASIPIPDHKSDQESKERQAKNGVKKNKNEKMIKK